MSKTKLAVLVVSLSVLSHGAFAETYEVLVAKQRQAMALEIDKKIADASGASKVTQTPAAPATPAPGPASTNTASVSEHKKPPHAAIDDLRVNGIYGVNGTTTVDVSIGDGPSYPITKDRSIKGWSLSEVSPSSVTFRNGKTHQTKTIYLAEPTTTAPVVASQQPAGGQQNAVGQQVVGNVIPSMPGPAFGIPPSPSAVTSMSSQ
jgi:hypothetical protein